MTIDSLLICRWVRNRREDTVVPSPSWQDVEQAVRSLNNLDLNDIYLTPDSQDQETYLCIGGGDGHYFISGAIRNETFPTFSGRSENPNFVVNVTVGGQTVEYPLSVLASLDEALEVARAFYNAGGFDCGVQWEFA